MTAADELERSLLAGTEVLLVHHAPTRRPSPVGSWAIELAGQLALEMGSRVFVHDAAPRANTFPFRGKELWAADADVGATEVLEGALAWARETEQEQGARRRLVCCGAPGELDAVLQAEDVVAVALEMEPWQSEATLFAASGVADLLGDPQREPLVPEGHYAAGTIGYAVFAALASVHAKERLQNASDVARLNGSDALTWINWKAAAAGALGRDIHREGERADWPVLPCRDGYVAIVYTPRDWPQIVAMVGDERLREERFASHKGRRKNRDALVDTLAAWVANRTKAEIAAAFSEYEIPAAPVATAADLLSDPLLQHRNTLVETASPDTSAEAAVRTPRGAHRVAEVTPSADPTNPPNGGAEALPLQGLKVLDLGIITAGAGTSGVLADLGAEVWKIESSTYPDPFRSWAGTEVSPLFKFNNRNKLGVDLDLKTEDGRTAFFELARDADLVLENFRRGVLDRLGITLDALRAVNPRILVASISAQGLTGPGSGDTTFGSTLEASSGFSAATCYDEGLPHVSGVNLNYPDQTVTLYGSAVVLLAALACREQGLAAHLDVSQRDVAIQLAGEAIERLSAPDLDWQPPPSPTIDRMFPTRDERWIAVSAESEDDLKALPELSSRTTADLASWLSGRTADEAVGLLLDHGLGAAVSRVGSELARAEELHERQVLETSPNGTLVKGFPFRFSKARLTVRQDSPELGEHTELVLSRFTSP